MLNKYFMLMNEAGDAGEGGGGEAPAEIVEEVVEEAAPEGEGEVVEASAEEEAEAAAEVIEEAIEAGASEEQVQKMIETFKIKVNGQEKEVELDWNNKDDIIRRLQMAEAAQPAMQRAAEAEKYAKSYEERLKENPWELLKEAGHDPDEMSEAWIESQIKELQKSPEQREKEARDKELEDLRKQLKEQKEAEEKAEYDRLIKQAEADLESEIQDAISATTQLPKTPFVMKRVADAMAWFMDQEDANGDPKYPNISAKQVVPIVEKEIQKELDVFYDNMPDEALEQYLSKKLQDRLRAKRMKAMPKTVNAPDTGVKNKPKPKEPEQKLTMKDFLKNGVRGR
jgi:hypothetical protein